jgi:uncharacterized membrane protein
LFWEPPVTGKNTNIMIKKQTKEINLSFKVSLQRQQKYYDKKQTKEIRLVFTSSSSSSIATLLDNRAHDYLSK